MKILLSEAHHWCSASRSKVYADAREGLLSTEKDPPLSHSHACPSPVSGDSPYYTSCPQASQ